ncbi:hypothetical protein [Candidatus Vidania fulgoroideorum]
MTHILIGSNVSKSLTPKLYYYIYKKRKKKLEYRGFNTNISEIIRRMILVLKKKGSIINITIPYKVACFQLCNYCTYSSYKAESTNLLIKHNNIVICFNTDRIGFKKLISKVRFNRSIKILIVGTGGAFKNIFEIIEKKKDVKKIYLLNRSKHKYIKLLNNRIREFRKRINVNIIISTLPINIFEEKLQNIKIGNLKKIVTIDISYQKKNKFQQEFKNYLYGEIMLYGQAIENLKTKKYEEKSIRIS